MFILLNVPTLQSEAASDVPAPSHNERFARFTL